MSSLAISKTKLIDFSLLIPQCPKLFKYLCMRLHPPTHPSNITESPMWAEVQSNPSRWIDHSTDQTPAAAAIGHG